MLRNAFNMYKKHFFPKLFEFLCGNMLKCACS